MITGLFDARARSLLRPLLAGSLGLLGLGCSSLREAHAPSEDSPNIVFILADDMGYGDPGCNNLDSRIQTPNIDSLAAEGMRLVDAHAPGSVCVPSRYGLLTGRYPFRADLRLGGRAAIEPGRLTIASLLQKNGYATAMVGKWHLGFDADHKGGPVDHGFDTYFGIPASLDIPPYYYIRDRSPVAEPSQEIGPSQSEGWTKIQGAFWRAGTVAPGFVHEEVLPRFTTEAVAYIDERAKAEDGKPFFLYVALTAPHTPWLPIEKFRGKSDVDTYGDFVMQVDDTVGQILQALDRNGMKGETLVIFSSDNGPVWYAQDVERFGHRSAGPLRGMKGDAFEGGHRVPFLVRWPGRVRAGSVSDQTICFVDMLATFAAIARHKLQPGEGEDSISILPVLLDTDGPRRQLTVLKRNASVIRQGKWKLITHLGSGGFSRPGRVKPAAGGPKGQLYDLEQDIGETTNLWAEKPSVVKRLTRALEQQK